MLLDLLEGGNFNLDLRADVVKSVIVLDLLLDLLLLFLNPLDFKFGFSHSFSFLFFLFELSNFLCLLILHLIVDFNDLFFNLVDDEFSSDSSHR